MCGRFVCDLSPEMLTELFAVSTPGVIPRSFNSAPSSKILAVRCLASKRESVLLRWGLIPPWAKDASPAKAVINARSETAAEKALFRNAFRYRRCIIPVNGFFEWNRADKSKQPYYIRMISSQVMGLAGLWERWTSDEGETLESCAILTISANSLIGTIHDRMPVILQPGDYSRWLDQHLTDPVVVNQLCVPCPSEKLEIFPVSSFVNNPRNNSPACIARLQ